MASRCFSLYHLQGWHKISVPSFGSGRKLPLPLPPRSAPHPHLSGVSKSHYHVASLKFPVAKSKIWSSGTILPLRILMSNKGCPIDSLSFWFRFFLSSVVYLFIWWFSTQYRIRFSSVAFAIYIVEYGDVHVMDALIRFLVWFNCYNFFTF